MHHHLGMIRRLQQIQTLQEHNRPEIGKRKFIKSFIQPNENLKKCKGQHKEMAGSCGNYCTTDESRGCSRTRSPATANRHTHEKRASLRRKRRCWHRCRYKYKIELVKEKGFSISFVDRKKRRGKKVGGGW